MIRYHKFVNDDVFEGAWYFENACDIGERGLGGSCLFLDDLAKHYISEIVIGWLGAGLILNNQSVRLFEINEDNFVEYLTAPSKVLNEIALKWRKQR